MIQVLHFAGRTKCTVGTVRFHGVWGSISICRRRTMKVRFLQPILLDVRSIQGRNLMESDGMLDVVAVIRQANAQLTTVRFRGLPGPPGRAGPRIKSQLLHASCTFFCTDSILSSEHPAARSTRSECWRSSSRSDVFLHRAPPNP